jgi:glucan 1,3-beta-glucosidase
MANTDSYGTGVEHHALFQYHFSNAKNIATSYLQTETPYYMPNPSALDQPFLADSSLNDPVYSDICGPTSGNCGAMGLRINNCENVRIYGAGLYSFFDNYNTTCSDEGQGEDCQAQIFQITSDSTSVSVYGLNTVGSQSMVDVDMTSVAGYSDNINVFPDTIALLTYG